jgi:hypothetical protein
MVTAGFYGIRLAAEVQQLIHGGLGAILGG